MKKCFGRKRSREKSCWLLKSWFAFLALRPELSEGRRGFRVSEPGHQDCGGGGEGARVGARLLGERIATRGSAGCGGEWMLGFFLALWARGAGEEVGGER